MTPKNEYHLGIVFSIILFALTAYFTTYAPNDTFSLKLAIIFGTLFTASGLYTNHMKAKADELAKPQTGQISGKILIETEPYTLLVGSIGYTINTTALKQGIDIIPLVRSFIWLPVSSLPIKIYEENNRLLFDVEILDKNNSVVCEIVRNEWKFNPNGKYDKNHRINAFEIVDENLRPMLQIFLETNNTIIINGLMEDNDNLVIFSVKGTGLNPNPDKLAESIVRLFKYPSDKFPGVFDENNISKFTRGLN